jgi:nicotinamide-nucleotide amidase
VEQKSLVQRVETASLSALAENVLTVANWANQSIATAEGCTGGQLSALLSGVERTSKWFRCGVVAHSNEAAAALLGIPLGDLERHGGVSREIAIAMAEGALRVARADVAVAVCGHAGPAGRPGNGLVHIAVTDQVGRVKHNEFRFGEVNRSEGRLLATASALSMLHDAIVKAERSHF